MTLPIVPTTAVVNGVNIYGGIILRGADLLKIADETNVYFQYNVLITPQVAKGNLKTFANMTIDLEPMQGVVLYVTTQLYEVVWRDAGGQFWKFTGITPKADSKEALAMIRRLEAHLERKFGK